MRHDIRRGGVTATFRTAFHRMAGTAGRIRRQAGICVHACLMALVLMLMLMPGGQALAQNNDPAIGVLRGEGGAARSADWPRTLSLLRDNLPGHDPQLVYFDDRAALSAAISSQRVDYVIVPPDVYVDLEIRFGADDMLTYIDRSGPAATSHLGSVVFAAARRFEYPNAQSLKGARVAATRQEHFSGWNAARYSFKKFGIEVAEDFAVVDFLGDRAQAVVASVLSGEHDIGVLPTGVLDDMIAAGTLDRDEIQVLNFGAPVEFPLLVSTPVYPEWTLSNLSHASEEMTFEIISVLLRNSFFGGPRANSELLMWRLPSNYWSVHEVMRALSEEPRGPISLTDFLETNRTLVFTIVAVFLAMFVMLVVVALRNIRLLHQRAAKIDHQSAELEFQQQALDEHAIVSLNNAEGRIEYVNDNFLTVTGFTRDDVIGKSGRLVRPQGVSQEYYEDLVQTIRTGRVWSGEIATAKKDGSIFWAQTTVVPFLDAQGRLIRSISIRTDITRNKMVEANKQLAASFDSLGDMVVMFWPDTLEFIYLNKAALRRLGWEHADTAGKSLSDMAADFQPERFARRIEELKNAPNGIVEFEMGSGSGRVNGVTLHYLAPEGERPRIIAVVRDVTEIVRRRSEISDLRAALDLAEFEVFIMDPETLRYTYLNKAAQRKVEWVGKDFTEMTPADDDPQFNEQVFWERVAPLMNGEKELVRFERDAFFRPTEVSIQLLELKEQGQRFVVVVRDITERKHWERQIRRMKGALDLSPDAIHMFWPDTLKFFYGNEVARQRIGATQEEFKEMTPMHTSPSMTLEMMEDRIDRLSSGDQRSMVYESDAHLADGTRIPTQVNLQYISPPNGRPYILALIRDLTASKKAEKAKSEFVATVSHELRTPLTSIKGSLGLVRTKALGELTEKQSSMIDIAYNNCDRLVLLINDILDLEKIEAGKMDFNMAEVDAVPLVDENLEAMESYAKQFGVKLARTGSVQSAVVEVDSNRLMQVLYNLTSNAVKFSETGDTVQVRMETDADKLRITVSDTGSGIPLEAQATIFDKFTQADSSDRRRKGGTGLGLSITRLIVENMGGSISFTSVPGEGTDFWVDLPLLAGDDDLDPVPDADDAEGLGHVLMCEDDPSYTKELRAELERAGYDVSVSHSARAARTAIARQDFDIMTLDLGLPDAKGVNVLDELDRARPEGGLPVVVVNNRFRQPKGEDPASLSSIFRKPPDPAELLTLLASLNRNSDQSQPAVLHASADAKAREEVREVVSELATVCSVVDLEEMAIELSEQYFDLVLLDIGLSDGNGLALLSSISQACAPRVPVIVFSGNEAVIYDDTAVSSVISKPNKPEGDIPKDVKPLLLDERKGERRGAKTGTNSPRRG